MDIDVQRGDPTVAERSRLGRRMGGTEGNEILTSAAAAVLTVLLAGEGITILDVAGLRTPHMVIGLALIPPLVVKLASTGYRFVRYYAGSRAYRAKGPPAWPLRLTAPLLVVATVGVFATGVVLLLLGHRSASLIEVHKLFFIAWAVGFAVHFLGHLPAMLRSTGRDWTPPRRRAVPGSGIRLMLVAASLLAGAIVAAVAYSSVTGWRA
ncbi:MAG TPA: hypothetical protein VHB30_06445 [Solirubrobacteraceae bacterium]|jgi:hypothetical protein|nr:hypothetical protein [Solirubrobacteraceae bacterium]